MFNRILKMNLFVLSYLNSPLSRVSTLIDYSRLAVKKCKIICIELRTTSLQQKKNKKQPCEVLRMWLEK